MLEKEISRIITFKYQISLKRYKYQLTTYDNTTTRQLYPINLRSTVSVGVDFGAHFGDGVCIDGASGDFFLVRQVAKVVAPGIKQHRISSIGSISRK